MRRWGGAPGGGWRRVGILPSRGFLTIGIFPVFDFAGSDSACISSNTIDTPPFFAYPLRPGITFTYLGVVVDERAQVILADDKPAKWEYAELSFRGTPPRPIGKDKDGNETPAAPGSLTLRWTTGAEDVTVKGWDELAEKLNAPLKKESSPVSQKIQVLNALGGAGWELVAQQATTPAAAAGGMGGPGGAAGGFGGPGGVIARAGTTTMMFKRQVK